jgi:hypothetical protein
MKELLMIKIGEAKTTVFINGLRDVYENEKYFGDYYVDIVMKDKLGTIDADRSIGKC